MHVCTPVLACTVLVWVARVGSCVQPHTHVLLLLYSSFALLMPRRTADRSPPRHTRPFGPTRPPSLAAAKFRRQVVLLRPGLSTWSHSLAQPGVKASAVASTAAKQRGHTWAAESGTPQLPLMVTL